MLIKDYQSLLFLVLVEKGKEGRFSGVHFSSTLARIYNPILLLCVMICILHVLWKLKAEAGLMRRSKS